MMMFTAVLLTPSVCAKSDRPRQTYLGECPTRRKARRLCRNQFWKNGGMPMAIYHPDGRLEPFAWRGLTSTP